MNSQTPAAEARELARVAGVDEELVRHLIWRIVARARQAQEGRSSWGPPEGSEASPNAE